MTVPQILRRLDRCRRGDAARRTGRVPACGQRCSAPAGLPGRAPLPVGVLRLLGRTLGRCHRTALVLWETGDHDARLLAVLLEQPRLVEDRQLDRWVETAADVALVDRLCLKVVMATPWARVKVGDWARHPQALVRRAAYVVLRALARCDREMTDADFIPWSDAIPSMAAREEPVVRAAMLAALSAIGERNAALRQRVLSAASRLRCVSTASLRPSPPALRATAGDWRPMG